MFLKLKKKAVKIFPKYMALAVFVELHEEY